MSQFRYDVSLRIRHPTMTPDEICSRLRMEAQYKWAAGAPRVTPKGRPLEGKHEDTYCSFKLDHDPNLELTDLLVRSTTKLMAHRELLEHIRSTGGSIEYFVGWYSDNDSGEVFNVELLKNLAALQIDLSLDVYGPDSTHRTSEKRKRGRSD